MVVLGVVSTTGIDASTSICPVISVSDWIHAKSLLMNDICELNDLHITLSQAYERGPVWRAANGAGQLLCVKSSSTEVSIKTLQCQKNHGRSTKPKVAHGSRICRVMTSESHAKGNMDPL